MKDPEPNKFVNRLIQNRQSAKKCRIKKKEEYVKMNQEVKRLTHENNQLKNNVSSTCPASIPAFIWLLFLICTAKWNNSITL